MWAQQARHKNRYLQMQLPHLKAVDINERVANENSWDRRKVCESQVEFCNQRSPFKEDRAKLAFGFRGLEKLVQEICSDDSRTQWRAMNTLKEVVKNPLEANRAILEMGIVRKLQNILLRFRRRSTIENAKIIEVILKIIQILSTLLVGAQQISHRCNLVNVLYEMISLNEHRKISSLILMNLTAHPEVIIFFLEATDTLGRLRDILKTEKSNEIPGDLWLHLSHFIEISPVVALQYGFFELLHGKLQQVECEDNWMIMMKCFAFLLQCAEGQEKLDRCDGIRMLYNLLMNEKLESHEYVALALQNGTISKRAIMRCSNFWDLPMALAARAGSKTNDRLQLYCLQTLRQITQMPTIKEFVRKVCKTYLLKIQSRKKYVKESRDNLIKWLDREVYDSSPYQMHNK